MSEKIVKIRKIVEDIGTSAFLKLHGFAVIGRKGKAIYFEINKEDEEDFNRKSFEYVNSAFYSFDSCVLAIKKIKEYMPE